MKIKSFTCKNLFVFALLLAGLLASARAENGPISAQLSSNRSTAAYTPHRIYVSASDGQVYNQAMATTYNPQPGDTLVIPTKIISFNISHFSGAPGNPIVIVPADSAYMGAYAPYVGNISYARYFKITGFHIDGSLAPSSTATPSNFGMLIGTQTDHYEACNLNIRNCGIGFCTKQNPDASSSTGFFPNYIQDSVYLHHIYVRKTRTEGFYIGYTNDVISPIASPINHLVIDHVTADSTGWDGVQLSDCLNVFIHDVFVNQFGLSNDGGQQNGMLFGGQVTLRDSAYNINVSNGTGAGLLIFGRQLFKVTDVVLINTGTTSGQSAIYVSDFNDLGYGTGPLQLDLRRIRVSGASLYALNNANNNGTTLPGNVRDFVYSNTGAGINDRIDVFNAPVLSSTSAKAGGDKAVTLPVSTVTLAGSATCDPSRKIASYRWSKLSGPASGTIVSPATASTDITNVAQGVYTLQLSATDNAGLVSSDTMHLVVNASSNKAPVAKVWTNKSITMPVDSIVLDASASSDPDGSIVSYKWSQVSGPSQGALAYTWTMYTAVNNLKPGVYGFRLAVTDNAGAVAADTIYVTVNPAPIANKAPVANAEADQVITSPSSSVVLDGSRSYDPDGTITRYNWTKIAGPDQFKIDLYWSIYTGVSNLTKGVYLFRLAVTDNMGVTTADTVMITVKGAATQITEAGKGLTAGKIMTNALSQNPAASTLNSMVKAEANTQALAHNCSIFPNPVADQLHLNGITGKPGSVTLNILNMNGRSLLSSAFNKQGLSDDKTINVSALKPGIYIVEVRFGDGATLTKQFIKL